MIRTTKFSVGMCFFPLGTNLFLIYFYRFFPAGLWHRSFKYKPKFIGTYCTLLLHLWKHPTRWLFKIAVLGGMFSWKIVGVLVKIWKRPSWKIGAVLDIARNKLEVFFLLEIVAVLVNIVQHEVFFIPGKFDLFL